MFQYFPAKDNSSPKKYSRCPWPVFEKTSKSVNFWMEEGNYRIADGAASANRLDSAYVIEELDFDRPVLEDKYEYVHRHLF
jgi:hypothetical protein